MDEHDSISSMSIAEPPEGALAGEDVPVENDSEGFNESEIQEIIGMLKTRGKPYIEMKQYELRERAIEIINETGEFLG